MGVAGGRGNGRLGLMEGVIEGVAGGRGNGRLGLMEGVLGGRGNGRLGLVIGSGRNEDDEDIIGGREGTDPEGGGCAVKYEGKLGLMGVLKLGT